MVESGRTSWLCLCGESGGDEKTARGEQANKTRYYYGRHKHVIQLQVASHASAFALQLPGLQKQRAGMPGLSRYLRYTSVLKTGKGESKASE